jgi:hypothetical protein
MFKEVAHNFGKSASDII